MYQAHYKNPLFQFQIRTWRLVLTDNDGVLPTISIEKSFPRPLATTAALTSYAETIATQAMSMQDPPLEFTGLASVTVDLPYGKEMTP